MPKYRPEDKSAGYVSEARLRGLSCLKVMRIETTMVIKIVRLRGLCCVARGFIRQAILTVTSYLIVYVRE